MTISIASSADCVRLTLEGLYLDAAGVALLSSEALAGSLRRAASFQCPTTPRQLVDAVMEAVQPLAPATPLDRQELTDLVEMLVSAGDLIELPPDPQRRGRLLYLGPPSFVKQRPGRYLVMGIRPFAAPLLGTDLERQIDYKRHVRSIRLDAGEAAKYLGSIGLHQIAPDRWVSAPAKAKPQDVILNARTRLDVAGPAGSVAGLSVLDPATSLRFYKGRWRPVRQDDNGDFVARRSQEHGADLWCYVRITAGVPERLIDFPTGDPTAPGRDEAWRLQAAIDAAQGRQHIFRSVQSQESPEHVFVEFSAPVPTWAERHLELVGEPVSERRKCLFSYLVEDLAIPSLEGYLGELLWMREAESGGNL
jgi:hypothetical protein